MFTEIKKSFLFHFVDENLLVNFGQILNFNFDCLIQSLISKLSSTPLPLVVLFVLFGDILNWVYLYRN